MEPAESSFSGDCKRPACPTELIFPLQAKLPPLCWAVPSIYVHCSSSQSEIICVYVLKGRCEDSLWLHICSVSASLFSISRSLMMGRSRNNQLDCILTGALYEKRAGPYVKHAVLSSPTHAVKERNWSCPVCALEEADRSPVSTGRLCLSPAHSWVLYLVLSPSSQILLAVFFPALL